MAARIGVHKASTCLTVVTLLNGDATEQARFFDKILTSTDFSDPQARIKALAHVRSRFLDAVIDKGFVQIVPFTNASQAMKSAALLSQQQTHCVDKNRQGNATGESVCVAGFTITITPESIAGVRPGSNAKDIRAVLSALEQVQLQSMDAFYLFYAPGPEDILPRSQAEAMVRALRKLGGSSFSKTA